MPTPRTRQKITTFLWFDDTAEEAARFYVSLFEDARIVSKSPMMVVFELAGQRFMALDGGPQFTFNEAISLYVDCENQDEVDALWDALTAGGGAPGRCGWLQDRFGLSWQIVPAVLGELMQDDDPMRVERVREAMLAMERLDVARLEAAYRGE